jgi:ADP-heptose:LPS heptosyltransferase
MGDVAMIIPVVLALLDQNKDVKITVISKPFFKPIFQNIPNVNFFSVHTQHRHNGLIGIFKLFFDLKKLNINYLADFHNVIRSKIVRLLFSFTNVKTAFTDKGRKEKKELTALKTKTISPIITMVERHANTIEKLGLKIDLEQKYFLPKLDIPIDAIIEIGQKNTKWIGIAPFAHYKSKTYPIDLMEQVIDKLVQNKDYSILLFGGGKHETEILDAIALKHKNVFNFAGRILFEHELQLISNLDVMLSMDSGNAHLAAMFGVKTITLWGATHPFLGFAPYNQPLENCLVSDREQFPFLPTSVYGNKKVDGYEDVMRSISVEKIVFSVQSQLAD